MTKKHPQKKKPVLKKCPTGIRGFDELTDGGLPAGRPTLVCGGPGCGKTLFGMEFLVRGATEFNEPGVFMAFEENADELAENVASLGMNLPDLIAQNKLAIDYVFIDRSQIEETGEYDLEGLFIRLNSMIESVGAKRVVLDTIEMLFAGLPNEAIMRSELKRLFRWLKDKKITAVITGEKGEKTLTRYGLEEYISDCVIFLDHRVENQLATRRLRVIKYRGSSHGTDEYPTLIGENGLSVFPVTALGLDYRVTKERISTGIEDLDNMFGGKGIYRGTTVLISGSAGTGKSSLAAAFARSVCASNEKCLYFSFEESPEQILRNMNSIGIDLDKCQKKKLLHFCSVRPTIFGLEAHLVRIHKQVEEFAPSAVILDPVTSLIPMGDNSEVRIVLTRIIDFLKNRQITAVFTSLAETAEFEKMDIGVSSLMDTWIQLRNRERQDDRYRDLFILKSRGMAHSSRVCPFVLSNRGFQLMRSQP
jgi:circadian clock protein KaiC